MLAKLLIRYMKPYRGWLIAVLIFQAASVLASLYLPNINADIINEGVAKGDTEFIWTRGGIMLAIAFGQIVAAVIATFFAARAAMSAGRDIRGAVYTRVSDFSEREISHFGAGSLITRNTNDVQQVQMLAMMGATMLVQAPLMAIGGIIMALRQDVGLSWLIAVAVPILLVFALFIISRMVPAFRAFQVKLDAVNRVLREQLTGVRVVRAFVREDIEEDRFRESNDGILVIGRRIGSLFVVLFPVAMLVLNVTIVGVVWFGGIEVNAGNTSFGTIFAFMQYIGLILMGVLMASFMTMMIPRAAVSADRIAEVLDYESSLAAVDNPDSNFTERGVVRFEDVSFQYPGAESAVVHNVSFEAKKGQTVAIVGSTGSGKTTLISLIPRLFDATSGRIVVGGVDVRTADQEGLWAQIGLVPQKAFLFSGTIASNLRFGRENATDEELWQALAIAQGKDFVAEMPDGLESAISQGGTNVSGGQRQRLAIARALVRNPEVLIFDDSFSALDVTTDAKLRQALWQELPEVTKIVVAQRVSTITEADRIIVIDDGQVVGDGTHEELSASNDTYREIVESQLGVDA